MQTGEFKVGVAMPGDRAFDTVDSISDAATIAIIEHTGQHAMSAVTSLLTAQIAVLAACNEEAMFDLLKHFVDTKDLRMSEPADLERVVTERKAILDRLVSSYEQQLTQMQGGGRA